MVATMVQYARNMDNFFAAISQPQQQIIVAAVATLAYWFQKILAHYYETGDVIFREQQVGRPLGFEERMGTRAVGGNRVFIGIEQAGIGVVADRIDYMKQSIGS